METTSLISVESIKSDLNAILDTYSDIDLFITAMENHFLRHTDVKGKLLVDYHTNHHDNAIKMYSVMTDLFIQISKFEQASKSPFDTEANPYLRMASALYGELSIPIDASLNTFCIAYIKDYKVRKSN